VKITTKFGFFSAWRGRQRAKKMVSLETPA
jgi:hypothetical protein